MSRSASFPRPQWVVCAMLLALLFAQAAQALITGGTGNDPLSPAGWPTGAAAVFNFKGRVAYWEGPPFGGGQWHAECRGDAAALTKVLEDFVKVDAKTKRVILHDGIGHSFWLNPNGEAEQKADAKIDWIFMVWQKDNFEHLGKMPAEFSPVEARDRESGPPIQLDIFAGGNVRWADVKVPAGLKIDDRRLEARGFGPQDGNVLEGKITDVATGKPIAGKMRLETVEPKKGEEGGGYRHQAVTEAKANDEGRWVLKSTPNGWHRIIIETEGYVPRIIGYVRFEGGLGWHQYNGSLSRSATMAGRVTDGEGKPIADVEVRLSSASKKDGRYESPSEFTVKTDAEGRFRQEMPQGEATIWIHKAGYVRPGLGPTIETPADDVKLEMIKSAKLIVTIDFGKATPPGGYVVHIKPEGGDKVGSWGGSGNIDPKHQITFSDVPPGKYVLTSQPNPGSSNDATGPLTVELKGGETKEITIKAKGN